MKSIRPAIAERLDNLSYGYGYTRGSGRVWVEIFGAGRVQVRVASSATGTGRVAEMVDPHTRNHALVNWNDHLRLLSYLLGL